MTVRALDQFGNVASEGRDVTLLASGSASVANSGLVSILFGTGTIVVSNEVAETVELSLSDTEGTGLVVTSTQDVTFTPGQQALHMA